MVKTQRFQKFSGHLDNLLNLKMPIEKLEIEKMMYSNWDEKFSSQPLYFPSRKMSPIFLSQRSLLFCEKYSFTIIISFWAKA